MVTNVVVFVSVANAVVFVFVVVVVEAAVVVVVARVVVSIALVVIWLLSNLFLHYFFPLRPHHMLLSRFLMLLLGLGGVSNTAGGAWLPVVPG